MSPRVAERKEDRFSTDIPVQLDGGTGVARNVSANGIYFLTDLALEEGAPVKFTLEFDQFPSGPIAVNCIARVVRVEKQGTRNGIAAAISSFEFHRIPRSAKSSDSAR
jgi:hypothetical protein